MPAKPDLLLRSAFANASRTWQEHSIRITLPVIAFAVAFLSTVVVGEVWARDDARPSIQIIGSGYHLSLLITSENARILIASGDNATDFSNALSKARHLTSRRIDVIVLAGTSKDVPVARYVRKNVDARTVLVVDGPLVAHLGDLDLRQQDVIAKPTLIALPGGIDLTVTPESPADGIWSALIQRGETTVIAGNSPTLGESRPNASALIYTGEFDRDQLPLLHVPVIALSTKAGKISDLRAAAANLENAINTIRVEPGSATSVEFVTGGLQINGDALELGRPATD